MLVDERHLYNLDFGLSSTIVPGLPFTTYCGSPGYASPEIVFNKKYNGPEVDIWSLGLLVDALQFVYCVCVAHELILFQELYYMLC